jgi:hypothetical protein
MQINKELISQYPWKIHFRNRNMNVAKVIPEGSSVLDLGGGFCGLYRFIKNCRYLSLDLKLWTDMTVEADFNKGIFPNVGRFQFLVCQGIMEYLEEPMEFLEKIKKYGDTMILTYKPGCTDLSKQILGIPFEEMIEMLDKCGWEIIFEKQINSTQKLFYCKTK